MFPPDLRLLPDSYFLFWLYQSYLQYIKLVNKKVNIYVPYPLSVVFEKTPERSSTTNFFSIYLFSIFAFLLFWYKKPETRKNIRCTYSTSYDAKKEDYHMENILSVMIVFREKIDLLFSTAIFYKQYLLSILLFFFRAIFFFFYSYLNTTPSSLSR